MVRNRNAFTLIELLVVVVIIAILAGLLFPVFARARDSARTSECVSNLRQLGNAIALYQQDFDDRFPFAIDFWDRNMQDTWRSWDDIIPNASYYVALLSRRKASDGSDYGGQIDRVLRPYTLDEGVWRCPGDTGVAALSAATATNGTKTVDRMPVWKLTRGDAQWGGTSYVYRTELGLHLKPMTRLRMPSGTNVFMDAAHYWHTRLHRNPGSSSDDWRDYDKGSYTILFADGHVKNVNQKEYYNSWWDPYMDGTRNTWSPFR